MAYCRSVLLVAALFLRPCDSAGFAFLHSSAGRPENLQMLSPVARELAARGHSVSIVRYDDDLITHFSMQGCYKKCELGCNTWPYF